MIYALLVGFWVSVAMIGALAATIMCLAILKGF